jgi:predicted protein tyrosine phosphatase
MRSAKLHVLFVCSRNQWRSPTAEQVFWRTPGLATRSAGTSPKARRRIQEADLRWADLIVVMETRHRDQLRQRFGRAGRGVPIEVLGIPDDYQQGDPELVAILEEVVPPILQRHGWTNGE